MVYKALLAVDLASDLVLKSMVGEEFVRDRGDEPWTLDYWVTAGVRVRVRVRVRVIWYGTQLSSALVVTRATIEVYLFLAIMVSE